ncbi:MAG: hypothetical protein NW208_03130 [Bryobacter sp.]|nr:hypothetical protein [Bryobacter sp.]
MLLPSAAIALLCLSAQVHDPDEANLAGARTKIPEPMVFDLIRPLGAAKGEVEVNSLFRAFPQRSGRALKWAPEVEFTLFDGVGIEFELPLNNQTIESTKIAGQATLPGPNPKHFIHGLQGIWEDLRQTSGGQADMLYLLGYRWNRQWSLFTMTGARRQWNGSLAHSLLANQTIFYQPNKRVVFGLESNFQGRTLDERSLLLMPQVHFKQGRLNFQMGTGAQRTESGAKLVIGWRISREF